MRRANSERRQYSLHRMSQAVDRLITWTEPQDAAAYEIYRDAYRRRLKDRAWVAVWGIAGGLRALQIAEIRDSADKGISYELQ